jgi:hypothetical protein
MERLFLCPVDDSRITRVEISTVPRRYTWIFGEEMSGRIYVGPKNPYYWWVLPPNYMSM